MSNTTKQIPDCEQRRAEAWSLYSDCLSQRKPWKARPIHELVDRLDKIAGS